MTRYIIVAALCSLFGAAVWMGAPQSADATGGGATEGPKSPLAAYRGFGHDVAADEAIYETEFLRREELVVECMRTNGHEYAPRSLDPSLRGATIGDVNALVLDGMSESEREAYFIALHGEPDPSLVTEPLDLDGDGQVSYGESFGGGCSGEAHRAVLGVYAARAVLAEEHGAMLRRATALASQSGGEEAWVGCMASFGHDVPSRVGHLESIDGDIETGPAADAIRQCDAEFRARTRAQIAQLEAQFVVDHEVVLRQFGVLADG